MKVVNLFYKTTEVLLDYETRLRELGGEPRNEPVVRDIAALEAEIGVTQPARYREFLAEFGGWYIEAYCPCLEVTPFGEHLIAGFFDADEVRDLLDSMITPRNMVIIGSGHFGQFTCLSIAGIDRGAVYALDSEFRVHWSDEEYYERFNVMDDSIREYLELRSENKLPEKPAGYDSLYLVAADFEEFLSRCLLYSDD